MTVPQPEGLRSEARRPSSPAKATAGRSGFADLLPLKPDEHELELRRRLVDPDGAVRAEAALHLGAAYLADHPRVATRLLMQAVAGPPLTAARAELRLAWHAYDSDDEGRSRIHVARARALSMEVWERSDELDVGQLRVAIDIASSSAFLRQFDEAVGLLQELDRRLRRHGTRERMHAPEDPELRQLAALVSLRLGQTRLDSHPAAAARALRRALAIGTGPVAAQAALDLARHLAARIGGLGAEIEELYRLAVDVGDPAVTPVALIGLGDTLWRGGQLVEAEQQWERALAIGDEEVAERVARRRDGTWQRIRQLAEPGFPDDARPLLDAGTTTTLGRLAARRASDDPGRVRRVIVVGAGTGGHYLLPEMTEKQGWVVVGVVDDDPRVEKVGGAPVKGGIAELARILEEEDIDQVVFAIPTASGETRMRALQPALRSRVRFVALPSMFALRRSHPMVPQLAELSVHETYGSQPWQVDRAASAHMRGRRVAITGVGSALGFELARRVAHGQPEDLLLIDEAPVPLLTIYDELRERSGLIDCDARITDCADPLEVGAELREFEPEIVLHCGGLVHERQGTVQPLHAARANVLAAHVVASAARDCRARDFVLASVHHAARRRSLFDLTKALAEAAVLSLASDPEAQDAPARPCAIAAHDERFRVSVLRLPNVWGEAGSVVDRFEQQLRMGGPLLVDKGAKRTFVHPWEAAQPLLHLLGDEHDGGLYALTLGEEVPIDELADRLLQMNDLRPGIDVETELRATPEGELSTTLWGEDETLGPKLLDGVAPVRQRLQLRTALRMRSGELCRAMLARDGDAEAIERVLDDDAAQIRTAS
ncbi:MAG TPA: polysaccharide biosynthesis protein [Conexibacter sp.]|nr:polysaccharide biosynthesis protein [Conexibacter sp.]